MVADMAIGSILTNQVTWLPMVNAAATLNVSQRTLTRRVASGQLKTKLDTTGQKLVAVPRKMFESLTGGLPIYSLDSQNPLALIPTGTRTGLALAQEVADLADARTADAKTMANRSAQIAIAGWTTAAILTIALLCMTWHSARSLATAHALHQTAHTWRSELTTHLQQTQQQAVEAESARLWLVQNLAQTRSELHQLRQAQQHSNQVLSAIGRAHHLQRPNLVAHIMQ